MKPAVSRRARCTLAAMGFFLGVSVHDREAPLPAAAEAAAATSREHATLAERGLDASDAAKTGRPAGDIDPEAFERKLIAAVKYDVLDRVLRLLEGVDAEELDFSLLHEAARYGSARAAEALLRLCFQ